MNNVILEVQDLVTRFYTAEGVVHAVNGVSFNLHEGETLAIVGESGCGKTVTMLSVLRLIPQPPGRIERGKVLFEGRDLLSIPEEEMRAIRGAKIAMVFQDPMTSLNPVMKVGDQIAEAMMEHLGLTRRQALERAVELLHLVGIPDPKQRVDDYPHQFSGGMRQRAMIAMALSCNPKILIADEPTTALDVTIQAQIVDLVKRLQEQMGMSVIWITHDLGVVARIADRVCVMYAGYIVERAPVRRLYADPRMPYTVGLLGAIPRLDRRHGERLANIEGSPPDLLSEIPHCPFAPRCAYVREICWESNPSLRAVSDGHEVACWVDIVENKLVTAEGTSARV